MSTGEEDNIWHQEFCFTGYHPVPRYVTPLVQYLRNLAKMKPARTRSVT